MAFEKALAMIRSALDNDVKHNKNGLKMSEIPEVSILLHSQEQIGRLSHCLLTEEAQKPQDLAAALAPLFHFMIQKGWTPEDIDGMIVDNLESRFEFE